MNDNTISEFMKTFDFLMRFDCFEAIDQMFLKLINADWSTESFQDNKTLIVTFLRYNARVKSKLKYYNDFLEKSIKYLEENNYPPKNLLHGII